VFARFLLQVVQLIVTELSGRSFHWLSATSASESCDFLCQELSHLLLYITHMFQSGTSNKEYLLLETDYMCCVIVSDSEGGYVFSSVF